MKTLIRIFLFSLFSLWLTPSLIGGLKISGGWQIYLLSAAVLGGIYLFVRPILKLLFFPINLVSLGLLSWLTNVAVLYLLTLVVPQITISAWQFPGFSYQGIIVPSCPLNQIATFIVVALTLSLIINFLVWLSR